jgi:hypothetical protein
MQENVIEKPGYKLIAGIAGITHFAVQNNTCYDFSLSSLIDRESSAISLLN